MECNLMIYVAIICLVTALVPISATKFACRSNLHYDFVDIDRFTDNMCAQCLWFMAGSEAPWHRFDLVNRWEVMYNYSDSINVLLCTPNCKPFRYKELKAARYSNNSIINEFKSLQYLDLLLDCCENSRRCCTEMETNSVYKKDNCPSKWDGFMCWSQAKSGTINYKSCPSMTYVTLGIAPTSCRNELAAKECWANGTWSKIWKSALGNNKTKLIQEEYTDYLRCSTPGATHQLRFIHVAIGVYILSLLMTTAGLILLCKFGSKKQPSNLLTTIHVNFLLSLIFTTVFSLLVLIFIKERHYKLNSMIDKSPIWCRIIVSLRKAARLTNYCWMLNEGIILRQMIVIALRQNINRLKFYLIGWALPTVIMVIYIVIHSLPKYDNSCWTMSMGYLELIYNVPPISFIVINLLLLVNIIYILFKKLSASQDKHIKSGVRASLFLVPVFGIQYVFYIVPFDPFESCSPGVFAIQYLLIITEALQGGIVATIFCFLNKEIQTNIKRYINKHGYFPISLTNPAATTTTMMTTTATATTTTTRPEQLELTCS